LKAERARTTSLPFEASPSRSPSSVQKWLVLRVPLDVARDEWATRDDLPSLSPGAVEHRAGEYVRESPPLQRLRHLGVREDDRVAVLDVRDERDVPVDVRLELTRLGVVDDRNLLLASRDVRHDLAPSRSCVRDNRIDERRNRRSRSLDADLQSRFHCP